MVGSSEWTFPYTTRVAEMLNLRITGQHGYARNMGSTPDALRAILSKFKHVRILCSPYSLDGKPSLSLYGVATAIFD